MYKISQNNPKIKTTLHHYVIIYYKTIPNCFLISEKSESIAGTAGDEIVVGVNNFAFLTFDTLVRTANGVISPITVTFLAIKSILKSFTPETN